MTVKLVTLIINQMLSTGIFPYDMTLFRVMLKDKAYAHPINDSVN